MRLHQPDMFYLRALESVNVPGGAGRGTREMKSDASKAALVLGSSLLLVALSGCGMPEVHEPAGAAIQAEAAPELLGGPAEEEDRPVASPPSQAVLVEARRPGWGAMAPIPNPEEREMGYRASAPEGAPYRLLGPTSPGRKVASTSRRSAPNASGRSIARAKLEPGPVKGIMVEPSSARDRALSGPRVRHWIIPVAGGR